MASDWNDPRPMAPHLQIWRWDATMKSSILHRACSITSYIGLILTAIGVACLAFTGTLPLKGLIFSPLGALGLFVFVFAFVFMALAQLRHEIWDRAKMMEAHKNNTLSWVMIGAALLIAIIVTLAAVR